MKKKIIRTSTVPTSLKVLLEGQLNFLLDKGFEVIGLSSAGEELQEVSKRERVKVLALNMQRRISPIKDFISLVKMFFLLKREKPDIVHSITPKAGLITMLAAKFAGVPIRIHTFTGLIFPSKRGIMQKLLIFMDRLLCWAATNIYPEGEGVKKDLIQFKITNKPLKVIANGNVNGIDTQHFSPSSVSELDKESLSKELGISKEDFVFVFVGRLVSDKGINELIQAFKEISTHKENAKLLLVGSMEEHLDPLRKETIQEIKENQNIIYAGFKTDVRPYFSVSNCLVFPSYREGFPNVVMQAGAMELPSIVSDINGCNEIIINGKNGVIIPPKDAASLREQMINILENRDLYLSLKSQSREMIVNRYQRQYVWEALLEEYNQLL